MGTVRTEIDGATDLAGVYLWLTQHRGQVVELDHTSRIALGAPISGAKAVIVALVLEDDLRPGPQLGGVLRALANRTAAEPVRYVFEGRSPAGLASDEAHAVAAAMLESISQQIAGPSAIANVA